MVKQSKMPCHFGSLPGRWQHGHVWTSSAGRCALIDYVSTPSSLSAPLPARSVLLIGDSTDRNKVNAICNHFGTPAMSYIEGLHLETQHGNSGYAACTLARRVTVGQFMHYGVMDEPYFSYAYPVKPPLRNESYAHLSQDAIRFRSRTPGGRDPTLIVLQSYAWDLAAECQRGGSSVLLSGNVTDWVARVLRSVRHVRSIFPSSRVMWRTSHPYVGFCATPHLLNKMNEAVRDELPKHGVRLLEWNWMMNSSSAPHECRIQANALHLKQVSGLHVSDRCNLQYMNVVLNELMRGGE